MTKICKRTISLLLALTLCLALPLSVLVSATDPYADNGLCITHFALGEVGYTENSNGSTKYKPGSTAEWCALFINWCSAQAGTEAAVPVSVMESPYKYKKYYANLNPSRYTAVNSSSTFRPQVGDLVFMDGSSANPGHIGIVIAVTDTHITTVEGNVVSSPGGTPMVDTRNREWPSTYIVGYARPNYTTDHSYYTRTNSTSHWFYCYVCEYTTPVANHYSFVLSDDSYHWTECRHCGYVQNRDTHSWMVGSLAHLCSVCSRAGDHACTGWTITETRHVGSCICGKSMSADHDFQFDGSNETCSVCGYAYGDICVMDGVGDTSSES